MADLTDFHPLLPAEEQFRQEHSLGGVVKIGDGSRPAGGEADREIRAAFIRAMMLGGDPELPCHEKGVQLRGAWVTGVLDLEGCQSEAALVLRQCRLERVANLTRAVLGQVDLKGTWCPGLDAKRLRTSGDVFLEKGFTANGKVRLQGARIGGNLSICDARFHWDNDDEARIAVSLIGARVGGALDLRNGTTFLGSLIATGAELGAMVDEPGSWPREKGGLALDGAHIVRSPARACRSMRAPGWLGWLFRTRLSPASPSGPNPTSSWRKSSAPWAMPRTPAWCWWRRRFCNDGTKAGACSAAAAP